MRIVSKQEKMRNENFRFIIGSVVYSLLVISFLVTIIYPAATYEKWNNSDLAIDRDGYVSININLPCKGTLYVRAYARYPSSWWESGDDEYEEDSKTTTVNVQVLKDDAVIEAGDGGGLIIGTGYKIPTAGAYRVDGQNVDGLEIRITIRFFGSGYEISCCFSCIIIPFIAVVFTIYLFIVKGRSKKLEDVSIEQDIHNRSSKSKDTKKKNNEFDEYYSKRWNDY